jgi:HK97 family phage major capsid protein
MPNYGDVITRGNNAAIEIPEQVSREVIQTMPGTSVIMNLARRVTMSSKSYRQPVLSVLPDAYWVNGDTGLKQTTKVQWEDMSLTAEPLAVLVVVPDEFIDDAMIPIWSEVRPLITEAFGRKIDDAALWNVNRPATWSDSVYQNAAAAGNFVEIGQNKNMTPGSAGSDLAGDVAMMGLTLANDGFRMSAFAAQTGFNWRLLGLRDTTGQPIYTNLVGENRQGLYGIPFVEQSNGSWNNTVKLIGGDWSNALVGIRQDMTFTMHTDAVISDDSGNVVFNAMQQDSKIMRVVMRVGFAIANPLTRENTVEATRSPFVLLTDDNSVGS